MAANDPSNAAAGPDEARHTDGAPPTDGQQESADAKTTLPDAPASIAGKSTDKPRRSRKVAPRKGIRVLRQMRRASQVFFFALFVFLLVHTAFRGSFSAAADSPVRLPWPVEGFLLFDPLAALVTLLSAHTVYRGMLWSLVVVALTLIFGRAFCGWICPLGSLNHFLGWIAPSKRGRGTARVETNRTHPLRQSIKYYLLYGVLGAALAGSAIGGVFDPICLSVRSIGLVVLPATSYVTGKALGAATDTNVAFLQKTSDAVQDVLTTHVWQAKQSYYAGAWFIALLFVAALVMNRFVPRFWCRVLCPLGALLGVTSRFALFGIQKKHENCTDCNFCLAHCQGADSPQGGAAWRQDECHVCLNCESVCPDDVIHFRFLPNRKGTTPGPNTQRRTALATVAAGAAFVPASRISDSLDVNYDPRNIRPPGAVDEREFLARCIRCGECMKVCPNNALQPAVTQAGVEGLWTPVLVPRIGYCEQSCVLCSQVCPTGAIRKITEKDRLGVGKRPVKLGTAFYDHGRCLPWAMQTPCIVCEEFCPTSPKAIWVEEVEVPVRDATPGPDGAPPAMRTVKLQRPHVDPSLCIGCGACEKVCPVQDQPAIRVSNVGESRSRTNVILLEKSKYRS